MDNFRDLLGIRRLDEVPNVRIKELCGVMKGVDERTDEGALWWFSYIKRRENDRIAKRVYVEECAGSRYLDGPRKRWVDTMKDCLKKKDV